MIHDDTLRNLEYLREKSDVSYEEAMELLSGAIAERSGRPAGDFHVRTIAASIVGCMFAVLAEVTDHPEAEMFDLIDEAFGYLEDGLRL